MPIRRTETQLSLFEQSDAHWRHASGLNLHVRQSGRARRLTLHVVPPGLLEVVVPRGVRPAIVEAFVAENRGWIEAAQRELGSLVVQPAMAPPDSIHLAALDREFAVTYRDAERPSVRELGAGRLEVCRRGSKDADAIAQLRRWLLGQAGAALKPWLWREAERLDAEPKSVQIRLQRTRWGSCSSSKRISLNAALLFVEPALVRYLLVHELCHLAHMNHSQRFWARVRRFEPNCDDADRRLGKEWRGLPAWIFAPVADR